MDSKQWLPRVQFNRLGGKPPRKIVTGDICLQGESGVPFGMSQEMLWGGREAEAERS